MKFIHISDIHLTENGREIWGVNTLDHFCKAIERIKDLDGIEGIFVSGDLSEMLTSFSTEQPEKHLRGISVTALGIVTSSSAEQPKKQ